MGYGAFSTNTSAARCAAKKAAGIDPFSYNQTLSYQPRSTWKVADRLNPQIKAGDKSPHAGQVMRECMISDDHPEPTPIVVYFDVTGSMGSIPRVLQKKLALLHGLLVRKGYASDPQIMFGAIGDANTDTLPFQTGQFESDNRLEEDLEAIVLEGGGGGQMMETYEIGAYFLDRHTYLDSFAKQGRKGYAFFVGDERVYPKVKRQFVNSLIGDKLEADVDTEEVFKSLQERYNVYYLYAEQGSYSKEGIVGRTTDTELTWARLLGERAISLDNADAVAETIATAIGLNEGAVTLDDALDDLADVGSDQKAIQATGRALATVGAGATMVASASGSLPGLDD